MATESDVARENCPPYTRLTHVANSLEGKRAAKPVPEISLHEPRWLRVPQGRFQGLQKLVPSALTTNTSASKLKVYKDVIVKLALHYIKGDE